MVQNIMSDESLAKIMCLHALFLQAQSQLFVSLVKPHKSVTSVTIARWLHEVLRLAGIDVSVFSGHSVRGESTSAAAAAGITTNDILKAADWSSDSVFRRFYYRPVNDPSFGRSLFISGTTET